MRSNRRIKCGSSRSPRVSVRLSYGSRGRQQLFTENTLSPILPLLERPGERRLQYLLFGIPAACISGGGGRGDKRGATRLAGFGLVCSMTSGLLNSHHVPQGAEGLVISTALPDALYDPVMLWLLSVAFEPFLRRYVPNTLIGWSRSLEGRSRDPLVGGNLLAGTAMGLAMIYKFENFSRK